MTSQDEMMLTSCCSRSVRGGRGRGSCKVVVELGAGAGSSRRRGESASLAWPGIVLCMVRRVAWRGVST